MMQTVRGIGTLLVTLGVSMFLMGYGGMTSVGALRSGQEPVPTSTRLPPPPLSSPTSTSVTPSSLRVIRGGTIELRVRFPRNWPWTKVHWQDLWTIVQWQSAQGDWYQVEGWQGELDDVATDEAGEVVGKKTWWIAEADLNKGPFRWLIYAGGKGKGKPLAKSELFYLPDLGAVERVEISLGFP